MVEGMKVNATLQCACWAEAKTKMDAIKALKCETKKACVKVFHDCKKMEDESVNLIHKYMDDHSMHLINQTAEILHAGALKDAGVALDGADEGAKQVIDGEYLQEYEDYDLDYDG